MGIASSDPSLALDASRRPWLAAAQHPALARWSLALPAALAALWAGRVFFIVVTCAVALAVLLWPLMRRVEAVVRVRALAAVLVLGLAGALTVSTGALVAAQLKVAGERVPDALRLAARDIGRLDGVGAVTMSRTRSALVELDRNVARVTGTPRSAAPVAPVAKSGSIVAGAVDRWSAWLGELLRGGAALLLHAGSIAILVFFLLCSGDRLARRLSRWTDRRPLARGRWVPLATVLAREVRGYGVVTLLTNVFIGLAVGLAAMAFGLEDPWRWGLLAAVLHLVPYAGMAVTMVLVAVQVYVTHEAWSLAVLAACCVGLVGLVIGSVLAAWLQGRVSRIDSALMFAGTVFFATLWGGWGLVLGPLLVVIAGAIAAQARLTAGPLPDRGATQSTKKSGTNSVVPGVTE